MKRLHGDEYGIRRWRDTGQVPSDGILNRLSLSAVERDSHEAARDEVFNAFSADSRAAARTSTPEMNNLAASGEES